MLLSVGLFLSELILFFSFSKNSIKIKIKKYGQLENAF